jgi:hypothetical protein
VSRSFTISSRITYFCDAGIVWQIQRGDTGDVKMRIADTIIISCFREAARHHWYTVLLSPSAAQDTKCTQAFTTFPNLPARKLTFFVTVSTSVFNVMPLRS